MNAVERALERQRLLLESSLQREALIRHGAGLQPLFETADRVREGALWIRHHPEVVVGTVTALAVARPRARRFLWQWARRGLVAWRIWRDSERWLKRDPAVPHTPSR